MPAETENKWQKIYKFRGMDCHIHPDFSIDARGSVEAFVRRAIELGLSRICFTTHIDLDPNRLSADTYIRVGGKLRIASLEFAQIYRETVYEARRKFGDRIEIVYGFEFSYEPHFEDRVREFIRGAKPEFAIGSVHSVDGFEITSRRSVPAAARVFELRSFLRRYYEKILSLARSGLFDVVGHIDGYKKYLSRWWGLYAMERAEIEILEEIAPKLADAGAKFEINSSAYKRGLCAPYPSATVSRILVSRGVEIGSVGSDAHSPAALAKNVESAINYTAWALKGI